MKTIDISNLKKGMTFPSYRQLCMAINQPIYSKAAKKEQMKKWRENYFDFTESRARNRYGGHTITIKSVKTKEEIDSAISKSTSNNDKYVSLIESILISSMKGDKIVGAKTQLYRKIGFVNPDFNTAIAEKELLKSFESTGYDKHAYLNDFKEKVYDKARKAFDSALKSMIDRKLITYDDTTIIKYYDDDVMREITDREKALIDYANYQAILEVGCFSMKEVYYHRLTPQYYNARTYILTELGIQKAYNALMIKYVHPTPYPVLSEEELKKKKKELNTLFVDSVAKYLKESNYLLEQRQTNVPSLLKRLPETEKAYLNNCKMAIDSLLKL